ncbi:MAG: EF-hand domain-containing protein [Akkermansia sp.]
MKSPIIIPLCCLCLSLTSCDDPDLTAPAAGKRARAKAGARPAMNQQGLENVDADGDGVIRPEERAAARNLRTARPAARVGKQGVSGEPTSTPSPAQRKRVIKKFDADGDGVLNEEERAAAKVAMQERRSATENE